MISGKPHPYSKEIRILSLPYYDPSRTGIIAEHKRRSPSKQNINSSLSVIDVAKGYEAAGVAGMSVLTDGKYFGGSLEDLNVGSSSNSTTFVEKRVHC